MNYPLITAIAAIFFAQVIKYPIAYFSRKSPELKIMTSTGGMPSSHSAAVSSLIASLIFEYGFSSPYVAIATIFGVIIMFDSMGVRRQSGEQGIVIDILVKYLTDKKQNIKKEIVDRNITHSENPLTNQLEISHYEDLVINNYLGHKPTEVFAGIMTGGFVAIVARMIYLSFYSQ